MTAASTGTLDEGSRQQALAIDHRAPSFPLMALATDSTQNRSGEDSACPSDADPWVTAAHHVATHPQVHPTEPQVP